MMFELLLDVMDRFLNLRDTNAECAIALLPSKSFGNFRHSNHRIGAHTSTNHTVPYGTVLLVWRCPRHFVPGYDRTVPPGHFATGFNWQLSLDPVMKAEFCPQLLHLVHQAHDQLDAGQI